jgi:hypothetical protein
LEILPYGLHPKGRPFESDSAQHLGALTEYVEIWKRFLAGTLPAEVASLVSHTEQDLYPLYDDLEAQEKNRREQLVA